MKKIDRVIDHEVEHVFSNRSHVYKSNNHDVIIKTGCDCTYQSVQGTVRGKFCSHILSVFKKILEDEGFKVEKGD